jgi:hypothetical protein
VRLTIFRREQLIRILVFILFVAVLYGQALDKSPKMQADRKALIEKAIQLEVFSRVERNGTIMPRAWTGKTFNTITFDAKQRAISVVYAFCFDATNKNESVAIIDGHTGKEIGRFDFSGLRMK